MNSMIAGRIAGHAGKLLWVVLLLGLVCQSAQAQRWRSSGAVETRPSFQQALSTTCQRDNPGLPGKFISVPDDANYPLAYIACRNLGAVLFGDNGIHMILNQQRAGLFFRGVKKHSRPFLELSVTPDAAGPQRQVRYREIYAGIDLVFYERAGELEFDFVVRPGADPKQIHIEIHNAQADHAGNLMLGNQRFMLSKPIAYQMIKGQRIEVASRFDRLSENVFGFSLSAYPSRYPLVIDPIIHFSDYFGGQGDEVISALASDAGNRLYVSGKTTSASFVNGGLRTSYQVFVSRVNLTDRSVDTAFHAMNFNVEPKAMAIATDGSVYVAGEFISAANLNDIFLLNFDFSQYVNEQSDIVTASVLQGNSVDAVNGLRVRNGLLYLTGTTQSNDFMGGNQTRQDGDAFVLAYDPSGVISPKLAFLGDTGHDEAFALQLDGSGNVYITGVTANLQNTAVDFSSPAQGISETFVARFDTNLTNTYLATIGGSGSDKGIGIDVDATNRIFVAGTTRSDDFQITDNSAYAGADDVFLVKLDPNAVPNPNTRADLVFARYWGGSGDDTVTDALIQNNRFTAIGESRSTGLNNSLLPQGLQTALLNNSIELFISEININTHALEHASLLGGSSNDSHGKLFQSGANVFLAGSTASYDFPMIASVAARNNDKLRDGVYAQIDTTSNLSTDLQILVADPQAVERQIFSLPISIEQNALDNRQIRFYLQLAANVNYMGNNAACSANNRVIACTQELVGNQVVLNLDLRTNLSGSFVLPMQVWSDVSEASPQTNLLDYNLNVSPEPVAGLSMIMAGQPGTVGRGDTLRYTHIITHSSGPDPATNVLLTASLDDNVQWRTTTSSPAEIPVTCDRVNQTVSCDIGTLQASQEVVIRIDVVPRTSVDSVSIRSELSYDEGADIVLIESNKVVGSGSVGGGSISGFWLLWIWLLRITAHVAKGRQRHTRGVSR